MSRKPKTIPGYDYGTPLVPRSPVDMDDFGKLEECAEFTAEDRRYLTLAGDVLADQAEIMVDAWRARIGKQEHLARWFFGPDDKPDERYKAAVKPRFVQWVMTAYTLGNERGSQGIRVPAADCRAAKSLLRSNIELR
jgi:hypothetical protein